MSERQKPEALTARLQGWLDRVRACEASGQTMAEYTKANGLTSQRFRRAERTSTSVRKIWRR